eukprot:12248911-Heterocapsa_arctica.AAC.1
MAPSRGWRSRADDLSPLAAEDRRVLASQGGLPETAASMRPRRQTYRALQMLVHVAPRAGSCKA